MRSMKTLLGLAVGAGALAVASPAMAAEQCVGTTPAGITCEGTHATITLAEAAAANNDTILVGPGTYNEAVDTSKTGLIFRGAQFNVSASGGRPGASESIINGMLTVNGGGGVRVDGFTFTAGVDIDGGVGTNDGEGRGQVTNNIFASSAVGLAFAGDSGTEALLAYEIARNRFSGHSQTGILVDGGINVDIRDNNIGNGAGSGVSLLGANSNLEIFRNSIPQNGDAGVEISSGSNDTVVRGNTIVGATGATGVRVDLAPTGTLITANRLRNLIDIDALVAPVNAANNWFGQNNGPEAGKVIGAGVVDEEKNLSLVVAASPTTIQSNQTSAIIPSMQRFGGAGAETEFPSTGITLATDNGTLRDNDSPPAEGPSIETGLSAGFGAATLTPSTIGTATVTARLDSQTVGTQVAVTAASTPPAGGGGTTPGTGAGTTPAAGGGATTTPGTGTTPAPTVGRLGLRLAVQSGRRGRVGSRVVFAYAANRVVRAQRVLLQRAVRVRVRGRTRIVFRNVTAATLNGRTGRLSVRFSRKGNYALRLAFRDAGTLRRSNAVGITVRPPVRR